MFTPNLEDPDQVLSYLSPMVRACHDAFDHGVSLADSKFSDLPFDPHLWAHVARFGANLRLDEMAHGQWERDRRLKHSGIELVRMPLVVRILKSQGGDAPHPGSSHRRRAFWSQQDRLPIMFGAVQMPKVANFILDWTVNRERQVSFALSKPMGTWRYRQPSKLEWRRALFLGDGATDLKFMPPEEEDLDIEEVIDPSELEADGDSE